MQRPRFLASLLAAACGMSCGTAAAAPVDPAFTYQGQLHESGAPASGAVDLRLRLYDAMAGGTQVGGEELWTVTLDSEGRFVIDLDFGTGAFEGDERWLEIDVAVAGSGSFATLSPRQSVQPAPYALFALNGNEGPAGPEGPEGPQGEPGVPDWNQLRNVPADIADGDDDTTYAAGTGLNLSGTTFFADVSYLQRRVSSVAPFGQYIRGISQTGAVTLGVDQNTTYTAGLGLDLTNNRFSIPSASIGSNLLSIDSGSLSRVSGGRMEAGAGLTVRLPSISNKLGVGGTGTPTGTIHVFSGSDISTTANNGYLVLGPLTGDNIAFDSNEFSARNNGAASDISINFDGGDVVLGGDASPGQVGIGETTPSDRLHVAADAGESAFRVQSNGTTRLRVNTNGGVSIGASNTTVAAGNAFFDGDVGIGDSTPDARLDVVGNIIASGTVSAAVESRRITFPPDVFVTNFAAQISSSGGGAEVWVDPTGANARANVHLNLPDGAIITSIWARVLDSSPTNDFQIRLMRKNFSSTGASTLAEASTTGINVVAQTIADTTVVSGTVDNETYSYYMQYDMDQLPTTIGEQRGYSVQVFYNTPASLR